MSTTRHLRPTSESRLRGLRPLAVALLALALSSCAPGEHQVPRNGTPTQVPVLALSQKPTLEIGVMEGDAHYTFQNVVSVLPLSSGDLVVSDGGAQELTLYAPDGTFVRRWGGKGDGPGEFRALSHVYAGTRDSIMAEDGRTARVSVFDSAGRFARQVAAKDISGDTLLSMDVWLYGRFWVDGAPEADARARVEKALDHLPPPSSGPGYRVVRVGSDGRLWVREPNVGTDSMRAWTVLSAAGEPEAVLDMPARFDPQYFGPHRVLGRWRGDNDVNFVRAYGVEDTGRKAPAPSWLSAPPAAGATPPTDEKDVRKEIRGAVRNMAVAQEIHYANSFTYTTDLDSLKWERPKDMMVDFVHADQRGWAAVFTRPGFDRLCALAYGAGVPPGWTPGMILCGPPPTSASGPRGG